MSLFALAWAYFRRRLLLSLSAVGIALGVGVLFAVLAVVNGFLGKLESTLRDFGGDVIVHPIPARGVPAPRSAEYLRALEGVEGIASAAPRVNWFGLVGRRGTRALDDPRSADLSGLLLVGVEPALEKGAMAGSLTTDELRDLLGGEGELPPILLGGGAADRLGVAPGEVLEVVSFRSSGAGPPILVRESFEVRGTFKTGQFEQDLDRAIVRRDQLARFARVAGDFTEIAVRVRPGAEPERVAAAATEALRRSEVGERGPVYAGTWRDQRSNLLAAVENQRGILTVVFFFIVLVAAYQLMATLILTVSEKKRDIGVLGALGATPGRVARFYVWLGLVISGTGTVLGLILGVILTRNLDTLDKLIGGGEGIFQAEVYQFDEIPIAIDPWAVLVLILATLLSSVFFSLVPALRAASQPIVRALHSA